MIMHTIRGLFCVLVLPLHTTILGTLAILSVLVAPGGDLVVRIGRLWSRIVLATAGVQVRPIHAERTAGGAHVVFCNHQSLFDIPALVMALRCPFRMVAKRELFWIPIFGWALWLAGFVPVNRANRDRAIASLSRAEQKLRRGQSVAVFAEGTRSHDGRLGPLKKGAFHLAQGAGVPMLPATVSGSRAVLGRSAWLPRPGRIDVHIGEPIPPVESADDVNEALLARATAALRAGYTDLHRLDLSPDPDTLGRKAAPGAGPTD